MRALIDNGIIKQEVYSNENGNIYIFRFQIFQLSESKFVIRPLEILFHPKENNEDGDFLTKFRYNDDTHSKIAEQDEENQYIDLLDYIYKNHYQMCNNLVSTCIGVFSNDSDTVNIYYLHPSGLFFRLIEYNKVMYKMDVYDNNGNIIDTLVDD